VDITERGTSDWQTVFSSTKPVSDSVVCEVALGFFGAGDFTLRTSMQTATDTPSVRLDVTLSDNLLGDYPRFGALDSILHFAPTAYDLDNSGGADLIVPSRGGVAVMNPSADDFCCNWPNLFEIDCYATPAVGDMDGDGIAEIAAITEYGLYLFDAFGNRVDSFPKFNPTGYMANSYPSPLMADLDNDGVDEVTWIADDGDVYAYRADGRSYFASRNGLFSSTQSGYYFGSIVPFLFCADLEGDGVNEVIAGYQSAYHGGGLYIWNALNGEPSGGRTIPLMRTFGKIRGGCIADYNLDGSLDIAIVGRTLNDTVFAAIVDKDGEFLEGWPKLFPEKWNVIVSYPATGDLDGDGFPELVFTISSLFNKGEIAVLRYDGTPFRYSDIGDGTWIAGINGALGCAVLGDVSGDGNTDIVVRAGSVIPGLEYERIFAIDAEGNLLDGWPKYTYAPTNVVTSAYYTPVLADFDGDGMLDMACTSDDRRAYIWSLGVPHDPDKVPWGQYLHDSRNSGVLPGRGTTTDADDIDETVIVPADYALGQNYPNPFNPATRIEFSIRAESDVRLTIYNLLGQTVRTLVSGRLDAGKHSILWDGRDDGGNDVASGLYFYRMQAGDFVTSKKMLKLK